MNSVTAGLMARTVVIGTFVVGLPLAYCQNTRFPLVTKPAKDSPTYTRPRPNLRRPIGQRFRLKVRAVIQSVADPDDGDGRYECFGTLRLNDVVRWSVPREEALNFRRGAGEQLDISGDTAHVQGGPYDFSVLYGPHLPEVAIKFVLSDRNEKPNGHTGRVALYLDSLNLLHLGPSEYRCRNGGGDAMLFVTIERTGYIYAPRFFPTPRPLPWRTPKPFVPFKTPRPFKGQS